MKHQQLLFSAVFLSLTLGAGSAQATNGYFANGYGTKNKGMAGSGVAFPQDAMAAATNPAGMAFVGERMDLGVALFNPNRSYTTDMAGPGFPIGPANTAVESGDDLFLIPHFSRNWMLDSDTAVGLTVYGNGGMNTDYSGSVAGGVGTFNGGGAGGNPNTGVNLAQMFIAPTYAKKISDTSSWGVTAIVAYQTFKATGLAAFGGMSSDATKLTDNGTDTSTGLGARLGFQTQLSPQVTMGVAYQSKINMSEFDKYAGLFAEQGDFDIPSNWTVGLAWNTSSKTTLTFDVQQINFSEVAAVGNILLSPGPLGADNGLGFGWDDMQIIKLGYQWSTTPDMTWRAGISHAEQPIAASEVLFNTLAPAVIEDHLSFGFTRQLAQDMEFNFAATHALNNKVSGTGPGGAFGANAIDLEMNQWEFEASWGWIF